MKPDTREWVKKAEDDFKVASQLLRRRKDIVSEAACFHGQQCVEKYLKARLVEARQSLKDTKANGNVTYEWDAEDRLVAINNGTLRSEFTYDGFSRRVKIVEKNNGTTTSTKVFVWVGKQLAEERDDAGTTVTKRFFAQGQINYQPSTINLFYTRDHLGNIRELTDSSGAVRARYEYDPYGRVTKVSGDLDSDFRYTGHYFHAPSGLHLALYRAYDADTGRWLNRDPIGEAGGLNLYDYVLNDPLNMLDPLGLSWKDYLGPGLSVVTGIGLMVLGLGLAAPLAGIAIAGLGVTAVGLGALNLLEVAKNRRASYPKSAWCLAGRQLDEAIGSPLDPPSGGPFETALGAAGSLFGLVPKTIKADQMIDDMILREVSPITPILSLPLGPWPKP